MKLFGWKSAAAGDGARPPLSRYGGGGAALGDWPRSYEAQVRAGYAENAIAQRSVRLVAEAVADAPLTASSPELVALIAARSGGQALLDTVAAYLLLHNEAIAALDLIAQPSVVAAGIDAPPAGPDPGQCWIVGGAPTGDWAGQAHKLAGWGTGGWRFVAPVEGMAVWVIADALVARFRAGDWVLGAETAASLSIAGAQVVGARRPAIANPSGGATIDAESRAALAAILAALRAHGLIET